MQFNLKNQYGLSACTENLEYSLHMTEDVKQHSLLDNYWCYLYERQVKYKQQTSNMKSLCKTFADRANQLYFTFLLSNTDEDESTDLESQFQCLKSKPVLLTASSVEKAIKLKQHVLNQDIASTVDHGITKTALKNGIFIGKVSYHYLTDQELEDVQYWLRSGSDGTHLSLLPTVCLSFSRILKVNDYDFGIVYRTKEHAISANFLIGY